MKTATLVSSIVLVIVVLLMLTQVPVPKTIILPPSIEVDHSYSEIIEVLEEGKEGEIIIIKIAGFGGSVHTGLQLFNAIKYSKATTVALVQGNAYSMHAILVCAADKAYYSPGTYLMFHDIQFGGPVSEGLRQAVYYQRDYMLASCLDKGILDKEDIKIIGEGGEIYKTIRGAE